jgi:Na+-driven multidrug efflux pump
MIAVLLFVFPTLFLSLFTRDETLLDIGATWIRIQCLGYVAMGATQVFQQSFMTAGATVWPMFVTLACLWGGELPLAYFLSQHTSAGALGIAWGVTIAMLARPLFHIPYFFSGRWMRANVFSRDIVGDDPGGPHRIEDEAAKATA